MKKSILKKAIKSSVRSLGYKISPFSSESDPDTLFLKALEFFEIDLVLDVGANRGQFAQSLRSIGYNNRIVSFEPLAAEHSDLSLHAADDNEWVVAAPTAIGDHDGMIEINVAGNSGSSSILAMSDLHLAAAPESIYVDKQTVPIQKLDTVAKEYVSNAKNIFLKMDTQGYEWEVMDGAERTLPNVRGIICELSLAPLYHGSRLWIDMIKRIESNGFTFWGLQPGFSDVKNGRMLQVDAIFFREG